MQENRLVPAAIVAAALIVGTSAFVLAQEPMVTEASATHVATLTGEAEVPPVTTGATGMALLAFDIQTNTLTWTVTWDGLTDVTGAHIHGPAAVGENADVLIDLVVGDIVSPLEGQTQLTAEQVEMLDNGMLYVNVHTTANAGGAIRGQIEAAAE
jgi:hypothetical protein